MRKLQALFQNLTRRELHRSGFGNLNFLAGARIAAFAGGAFHRLEAAEAGNGNAVAVFQRVAKQGKQRVVGIFSLGQRSKPGFFFQLLYISSAFVIIPPWFVDVASLNRANSIRLETVLPENI